MKSTWQDVHLKLSTTLPSKIHCFEPREEVSLGQKRAVVMRGRKFNSIEECAKKLKLTRYAIYREGWFEEVLKTTPKDKGRYTRPENRVRRLGGWRAEGYGPK